MGGFTPEATPSPPPPVASNSEDEDDDDGDDDDALDDDDGDALDMRVVILRGRVSIGPFCQGECCYYFFEGCSEDIMYLFFSFFLRYIVLVHEVL